MKRGALILGALLALVIAGALFSGGSRAESKLPSMTDRGPRGAAVVSTWLSEAGVEVQALDRRFDGAGGAKTIVIAAPGGAEWTASEVEHLQQFVNAGGTVVYLVSRQFPQPALNRWLGVESGETPPLMNEDDDVGGTTASVLFSAGLLTGMKSVRLAAARMIEVKGALEVIEHGALWFKEEGLGEVWVAGGPDLIENARLELNDNRRFWQNLGTRGPIAFDELHHHDDETIVPVNLLAAGAQLLVVALLFLWSAGTRFGKPREIVATAHRSSLDYVRAFARLMASSGSEVELEGAVKDDFRRQLEGRYGIDRAVSWEEASIIFGQRTEHDPMALANAARTPGFVALSRALASLLVIRR